MKTFKEQASMDDLSIFLNADEFAEEHDLNGTTCLAVVQSPTAHEMFQRGRDYEKYEGIHGKTTVVHCRTADLPEIPVEGMVFKLDGEIMLLHSCTEDMGMLSLELHGNEV